VSAHAISLFLSHNTDLGPPYRVLVDTNFINFSIQNKIELVQGMMDCLMAKCELCTGCCVVWLLAKLSEFVRTS
jgi:U3 small nucleolar RNA-associated protein 24